MNRSLFRFEINPYVFGIGRFRCGLTSTLVRATERADSLFVVGVDVQAFLAHVRRSSSSVNPVDQSVERRSYTR